MESAGSQRKARNRAAQKEFLVVTKTLNELKALAFGMETFYKCH